MSFEGAGQAKVRDELVAIRKLLEASPSPGARQATANLDDAVKEVDKPAPDRHVIATKLAGALAIAKSGAGLFDLAAQIAPRIEQVVQWLGVEFQFLRQIA